MKTLSVTYDLRKPGKDYSSLIEAIKAYGDYAKLTLSQWAVRTNRSASEVRDHLKQHIDGNDVLFVCRVYPSEWASYNLPDNVADWLKHAATAGS